MEAKARQTYVRMSPLKMRIIVNEVRGMRVPDALNKLRFMPQMAARTVEKTIASAYSNLRDKFGAESIDENALYIREIFVDSAPMFKRIQPVSRGRAFRIKKRNSHLTVVVANKEEASE
ncbi:MAG TPA: 50S ribosomal protein L22 [Bacteroidetes bacterium]|nr:50S ribosomal protein L22 [Bacteroidetes Order II. bacterium]HCR48739.1 50S ribosomal protein L22 [Bacteroidota bacterium]HRR09695.1 50S ribosomal protein L22 [Rhodothermales bacterium]